MMHSEHTDRPEGEGGSKLHSLKAWNVAVIFAHNFGNHDKKIQPPNP
jgi:hypothetical protein